MVLCFAACAAEVPAPRPPAAPDASAAAPTAPGSVAVSRASSPLPHVAPVPAPDVPEPPRLAAVDGYLRILDEPRADAPLVGLARAGQRVVLSSSELASPASSACAGGFYAVAPRGFACLGDHATLDAADVRVAAAREVLPDNGAAYPLHYGYAKGAPHYRWLPSEREMRWNEPGLARHLLTAPPRAAEPLAPPLADLLAEGDPERSARAVELEGSKVAWARTVSAMGRTWVVTPKLLLVPLDRVREAPSLPSAGTGPDDAPGLPLAFVRASSFGAKTAFAVRGPHDDAVPQGNLEPWSFLALSGERHFSTFGTLLESAGGVFVRARDVSRFARESPPGGLRPGAKWVSVHLGENTLVAYEGDRPVFAAAVSTGAHGAATDGEHRTALGTFHITSKWLTQDMAGRDANGVAWRSPEVPYVAYYDGARALHGAWWHDWFGRPRSHGCINLTPADARWLFAWLDPPLPPEWYAVMVPEEDGTLVVVRP